ncbi:DExH-box ATP-dependent RNA helicase DExH12-like [Zingiber officinale]|uniref:DExH-box ATP-dependent RNA helicase DExH12-like n=1 Tax=Zingiber officinale TaxID=94328 RepID=UPI001C4C9D11|nr:DExH-box ATP-dependent RNA helicase DExH12-like [Zingiber officinale]
MSSDTSAAIPILTDGKPLDPTRLQRIIVLKLRGPRRRHVGSTTIWDYDDIKLKMVAKSILDSHCCKHIGQKQFSQVLTEEWVFPGHRSGKNCKLLLYNSTYNEYLKPSMGDIELFRSSKAIVSWWKNSMCWGQSLPAHLVVVMGTQFYNGGENAHTDYPITDLLQMMVMPADLWKIILVYVSSYAILLGKYYKEFLFEAIPVESHLHHFLHDHMNAEVVVGVVENKQYAVDYLTWTFMYRRFTKNPNYYNVQVVSHRHPSDHLSELVENVLSGLEASRCVAIEEDMYLKPLNLGLVASYYYISYTIIERFSSSITSKTKMKGLLDILASATEYAQLAIRPGEEELIRKSINHKRFSFENPRCTDPHVKANAHCKLTSHVTQCQGTLQQTNEKFFPVLKQWS